MLQASILQVESSRHSCDAAPEPYRLKSSKKVDENQDFSRGSPHLVTAANFWLHRRAANSNFEMRVKFATSDKGGQAGVLDQALPLLEPNSGLFSLAGKAVPVSFSDKVRSFFSSIKPATFRIVSHAAYAESTKSDDARKATDLLERNVSILRKKDKLPELMEALMTVYLVTKGYGFVYTGEGTTETTVNFIKEGLKLMDSNSTLETLRRVDCLKIPGRMQLRVLVGTYSPHLEVRDSIIENVICESKLTMITTLAEIAAGLAKLVALGSGNVNELKRTYGKIHRLLENVEGAGFIDEF